MPGVVGFEDARRIVEEHAARVRAAIVELRMVETVELMSARGRVLAEDLIADRHFPPFPRATRDGYAVRAADVERVPARLEVVGEIKAGDLVGGVAVGAGQAVSIMTGTPLPAGADAVVMVEYTASSGQFVEIQRSVTTGENFVPRGAEARTGQVLVEAGRWLDHPLIAIAASVGKSRLEVFRRPRVAVLSTGDEVVEIGETPGPSQIRNSNSYSLAAQIEEAGAEAVRLEIAPDEPARLRALILEGLQCNLLLLTGGVSMGKYDLVEQVLGELGAEFYFTGAKIQPGKPVVFGSCGVESVGSHPDAAKDAALGRGTLSSGTVGTRTRVSAPHDLGPHYFFGLPGNPVSTMVTFRLFAKPLISALSGATPEPLIFLSARLKTEVRAKAGLMRFLPAVLSGEFARAEVELAAWQGSGDIAALARANCYLVVPPGRERIASEEMVSVMMR